MALRRRNFNRLLGQLPYPKMFIIAAEGIKTEPQYFGMLGRRDALIQVKCLKGKHDSAPPKVLKRMQEYLREEKFKKGDEAWLVVDKDQWTDDQLCQLSEWAQTGENYGFALSNPKFEYWLLLHFEDGNGISSSRQCSERLKSHLPDYDKGINKRKFNNLIENAVDRAKRKDTPPCKDWPRNTGTTVYRLVERVLTAGTR